MTDTQLQQSWSGDVTEHHSEVHQEVVPLHEEAEKLCIQYGYMDPAKQARLLAAYIKKVNRVYEETGGPPPDENDVTWRETVVYLLTAKLKDYASQPRSSKASLLMVTPLARTENISVTKDEEKFSSALLTIAETPAIKELSSCEETPQQEVCREFTTKAIQTKNETHLITESTHGLKTMSQKPKESGNMPQTMNSGHCTKNSPIDDKQPHR